MKIIMIFFIICTLVSCGKKEEKKEEAPKITWMFTIDNSLSEYVKCGITGEQITCEGEPQSIPPLSLFDVYKEPTGWKWAKMKDLPDGCYINPPFPETDLEYTWTKTTWGNCDLKFWLYEGTDTNTTPKSTWNWTSAGQHFTKQFHFLQKYTFRAVNVNGSPSCSTTYGYYDSAGNKAQTSIPFNENSITFSGLFSLQPDTATKNVTNINKNNDFTFGFMPAVDVEELHSAGVTDETVADYFAPHMGDFVVLNITDESKHNAFCKMSDRLEGQFVIPSHILKMFYGETTFLLTRFKLNRVALSPLMDLLIFMKVDMHETGTDAYGMNEFTAWIQ